MGVGRCRLQKKRLTGAVRHAFRKKRKYEMARLPAHTKMDHDHAARIHPVRVRGGATKWRALRLSEGNFAWGTERVARKCRILNVVYNASSNELVRTNILVKNAIVVIDSAPFRSYYDRQYGLGLGRTAVKGKPVKTGKDGAVKEEEKKYEASAHKKAQWASRACTRTKVEKALRDQFKTGRLLACISSRPGQTGRADGYVLEGRELEFYLKRLERKKKAK